MSTLFVKTTQDPDGQSINWQRGFEYTLEDEYYTENYCITEYTIYTDDIPEWLYRELETNPDVCSFWQ